MELGIPDLLRLLESGGAIVALVLMLHRLDTRFGELNGRLDRLFERMEGRNAKTGD